MPYDSRTVEQRYCVVAKRTVRLERRIQGYTDAEVEEQIERWPEKGRCFRKAMYAQPLVLEELCLDRSCNDRCPGCKFYSQENLISERARLKGAPHAYFDPFS